MVKLTAILSLVTILASNTVSSSTQSFRIQRTEELWKELQDFENIISKPQFLIIVGKHYIFDGEFRKAFNFLSSSQLQNSCKNILDTPEFAELVNYLRDSGFELDWNAPNGMASLRKIVSNTIEDLPAFRLSRNVSPKTVKSFIQDVISIIPRSHFKSLVKEKDNRSAAFRDFHRIISQESVLWTHVALHSSGFKSTVDLLSKNGINVQIVLNELRKFLYSNL